MIIWKFRRFSAALAALKRKNRYQKQLEQIDGTLTTIEMQREALEGANTNTAVLQTMKNTADALKAAHKHMNVDDVHDIMDDIAEQQELSKEVTEAISTPVGYSKRHHLSDVQWLVVIVIDFRIHCSILISDQDVDEDELERELEELEQEELDRDLLGVGTSTSELPEVPTAEIKEPDAVKEKKKGLYTIDSVQSATSRMHLTNYSGLSCSCSS